MNRVTTREFPVFDSAPFRVRRAGRRLCVLLIAIVCGQAQIPSAEPPPLPSSKLSADTVQSMWGRTAKRNNVSADSNVPETWAPGEFSRKQRKWDFTKAKNVKWAVQLGSQTYGNPVVADGRVFVGTNNAAGYLNRFPSNVDLGCLLCFDADDGSFLWQYSSTKHPWGRVVDWPLQGICSAPLVEGNRLWVVDNRGRVVCLDTEGFRDGEDDGPVKGQWQIFLEDDVLLETSLRRLGISPVLRAAFSRAGVKLPPCSMGRDPDFVDSWVIWIRQGKVRKNVYRVQLREDRVIAKSIDTGTTIFQLDNRLIPKPKEGRISAGLAQHFFANGVRLSSRNRMERYPDGDGWLLKATDVDGGVHEFHLLEKESRLTVSKKISDSDQRDADVVWRFNMMTELGVRQHNLATCSPAAWGNVLFINTSNGLDSSHVNLPAPDAPSFIALDKHTGEVLWTDRSPGANILHGQWSAPAIAELGGVPQVIFAGGDGWVYSFRADKWDRENARPILLWKFDANPKESKWILGGRGTRNNIVAIPVIAEERVFVAVGQDPEHGEGQGLLWCIDPTRRGDVSPQLAMTFENDQRVQIPHRRLQAVNPKLGEFAVDNPNSAVVWRYDQFDVNGDGRIEFAETMHRTLASPVIKDGLLFIPDLSGLFHCLDSKTGKVHWTCDLFAACWGSALIAGDRVFVGDTDGDIAVFPLTRHLDEAAKVERFVDKNGNAQISTEPKVEFNAGSPTYGTPVAVGNVMYLATKNALFAITQDE